MSGIILSFNEDGKTNISIDKSKSISKKRDKGESLTYIPSEYIVIDIETTGLNISYDEIIEIGALKISNNEVVDQFSSLIKPNPFTEYNSDGTSSELYIDEFISELTGITNEMLESAPSIVDVLNQFKSFIGDSILAGHNVNFDLNFLYDNFDDLLNFKLNNDFIDLMRIARRVFPEFENHKLKTIAKKFNLSREGHHRALNDCNITFNCLKHIDLYVEENNIDFDLLFKRNSGANYNDLTNIQSNIDYMNTESFFHSRNIVFTGELSQYQRKDAAQIAVNFGAIPQNSVTKNTEILVVGEYGHIKSVKDGKTSKHKKAEELILKGQDIEIIDEITFYEIIEYEINEYEEFKNELKENDND